ncbi:MAG: DMT family transporter, partial [Pseudomonadota bacterium]
MKGVIAGFATAICWSMLSILLKFALLYTTPSSVLTYRMIVAFGLLFFVGYLKGAFKNISFNEVFDPKLCLMGCLLSGQFIGFIQGVRYTNPENAQVLIQFGPFLTVVLGLLFFRERISRFQIIGFLFLILGSYLFFSEQVRLANHHDSLLKGSVCVLLGAISWAFYAVLQKILAKKYSILFMNTHTYAISVLLFLPFINLDSLIQMPLNGHIFLFSIGLNTIFSYGFLSIALKHTPMSVISPILIMNPILT